ncbi:MAG: ATP-binding protein [Acidobacteriota bacterium]
MLQIKKEDVLARLKRDNPWWGAEANIAPWFRGLPHRLYFDSFYSLVATTSVKRAVVMLGPRRVGKTVMLYQAIARLFSEKKAPNRVMYLSLDTPTYTGMALEELLLLAVDSNLFIQDEAFLFFDEIQYLKDWERHLKSLVDSYPGIKFIASGSAAAALRFKSQESGAGRFTDYVLPPLSFAEYINFKSLDHLLVKGDRWYASNNIELLNNAFVEYINYGGYPEAVFSEDIQRDPGRYIRQDIIDKVLLRDLPSLYGISNTQELNRFFAFLAYHTGNEMSLESLSQGSGVSKPTLTNYIKYLEAAFLIAKVRRVDESCNHFTRERNFKVYLTNPSLRAALFEPVEDDDGQLLGHLAETAVISQWLHSPEFTDKNFYSRWRTGEVDLIHMERSLARASWAVEIKWSDAAYKDTRYQSVLAGFLKKNNIASMIITSKSVTATSGQFQILPTSAYCYTLGMNIISSLRVVG